MTEAMRALLKKHREILLYLVFGVLTTVVNYAVYLLCRWGLPEGPWKLGAGTAVAWVLSVLFAYLTNRRWVFQSKADTPAGIRKEVAAFFAARVFSLLVDMVIMYAAVTLLGVDDRLVKLLSNVVVILLNYLFSKFWIFKGSPAETPPDEVE